MGKRELLIVIGFVLVGGAAYQLTAPAPRPGERRFSFTEVFSGLRREISRNAASATVTLTGTIPVQRGISELRVTTSRGVPITITGERRDDIAYEMPVESSGPDEATALEYAKRTALTQDDLGAALALKISYPNEGTQRAQLVLHVPTHLAIRIESSGRLQVSGTASLDLRSITAETTVSSVSGSVSGSHRSGELTVTDAGAVDLTLTSSRATFRNIARGLNLNARSGECDIVDSRGTVQATLTNVQTTVTGHKGAVHIGGEGGKIHVAQPEGEVSVDVKRALVEVTLSRAVPAALITTEEPLRLILDGTLGLAVDAVSSDGGSILGSDFKLEPAVSGRDQRLVTTFGGGGPRVVLRNGGGNIVISRRQ